MESSKSKRTDLTILREREICEYKEGNEKATQAQIADFFSRKWGVSIARRTVGDILKRKADWTSSESHQLRAKRARKSKFTDLEEALGMWFTVMQTKKAL